MLCLFFNNHKVNRSSHPDWSDFSKGDSLDPAAQGLVFILSLLLPLILPPFPAPQPLTLSPFSPIPLHIEAQRSPQTGGRTGCPHRWMNEDPIQEPNSPTTPDRRRWAPAALLLGSNKWLVVSMLLAAASSGPQVSVSDVLAVGGHSNKQGNPLYSLLFIRLPWWSAATQNMLK